MLPRKHPDRIRVAFDDHRLVANAGLILPVTLGLCQGFTHRLSTVHNSEIAGSYYAQSSLGRPAG